MRNLITMTALALGLSSGAAFADRGHSSGGHAGGGHASAVHGGGGGGAVHSSGAVHGGGRVEGRREGGARFDNHVAINRGFNRGGWDRGYRGERFEGRGYYGHERFYDFHRRPELIIENYAPRAGYLWVPGSWQWDGYEWQWVAGYYQPDASYYDGY